MDKYESKALNAGTAQRDTQYFVTMCLNELTGLTEHTDTQTASLNLNHSSFYSSKRFWYVFMHAAHKRQLENWNTFYNKPADDSDDSSSDSSSTTDSSDEQSTHDEEETTDADSDTDSEDIVEILKEVEESRCADTVIITKDKDGKRTATLATQDQHYEHRGEALKDYSLVEWTAKIVVRRKPKAKTQKQIQKEQLEKSIKNPTNAGRPLNQRWEFRPDYKHAKTHNSTSLARLH